MNALIDVILPVFVVIGFGYAAARSGLLDSGSFVETLAGWAKTVVTGRGRLGGMPLGVIVTENRLVEKAILADPANLESKPEKAMQAGQVWFPDSAYKTAQALPDLVRGVGDERQPERPGRAGRRRRAPWRARSKPLGPKSPSLSEATKVRTKAIGVPALSREPKRTYPIPRT